MWRLCFFVEVVRVVLVVMVVKGGGCFDYGDCLVVDCEGCVGCNGNGGCVGCGVYESFAGCVGYVGCVGCGVCVLFLQGVLVVVVLVVVLGSVVEFLLIVRLCWFWW